MVLTISNEYGAGGLAIAEALAERTHFLLVDEQLPIVVAKRLSVTPDDVEAAEDPRTSVAQRWISSLELATPELAAQEPFDETCLAQVQTAVREFAVRGDVIIMGRGASVILGEGPRLLRVFLHADRAWRIARVAQLSRIPGTVAGAEIDRMDSARRAYMRRWYDATWGDPSGYDCSLDVAHFGIEGCTALIEHAIGLAR